MGEHSAPAIAFDPRSRMWVVADPALVREALLHPALRVRPPLEPVPAALQGRPAGEVFARLVRMNDGAFHARHRPGVAAAANRWDAAAVDTAARASALDLRGRVDADALLSALPVQAMARLLGVRALDDTVRCVQDFVQGIAAGASAEALAAAVVARVVAQDAPIRNTRRFAAEALELGGAAIAAGHGLLLMLDAAGLAFGAGAHACPGERVALRIAAGALQALQPLDRWFGPVRGWRPLPNARIPLFSPPQGAAAWSA